MDEAIQTLGDQVASTFDLVGNRLDSESSIQNDNHEEVLAKQEEVRAAFGAAASQIEATAIAREEASKNAAIAREEASINSKAKKNAAIAREKTAIALQEATIARVEASEKAAIAREEASEKAAIALQEATIARVEASEKAAIAREEAREKAAIAREEAREKAAIAREEAGAKAAIAREEARDISVDRSFRQSDEIWASRHLDLIERVERSRIETALHNEAGHADASKERTRLYNGAFGKIRNLERNIFEIQKVRDGDKELLRSSIATPLKDIVLELKNQNVDPQLQDLDGLEEDPWTTFLQDTWNTVDTFNEPSPTKSRGWSRDPSRAGSNTASPARSRGHSPVKV